MDKDIELQKIQALQNYFDTKINAQYSLYVGGFVSILILIATLYYQGIFDITDQRLSGLIIFAIAALITFVFFKYNLFPSIKKQQDKFLNLVDDLLKKVEKGEALPSLMELKKVARKKESKT